jgi:lantibiotic modifying enzyme
LLPSGLFEQTAILNKTVLGTLALPLGPHKSDQSALGLAQSSLSSLGIMRTSRHLPVFGDRRCLPIDYLDDILNGFHDAYNAALAAGSEGKNMILQQVERIKPTSRIAIRATRHYVPALNYFYSSPLLAKRPDDKLRRMQKAFAATLIDRRLSLSPPILAALAGAEGQAISRGDIPFFWTSVEETGLWTCSGRYIPTVLASSGLTELQSRIAQLHLTDLRFQGGLMKTAIVRNAEARLHGHVDS